MVSGDIFDLVALVARNSRFGPMKDTWFKRLGRAVRQHNDAQTARRNASHHYDLSVDLYRRFSTWTCSTAAPISPGRT